MQMGGDMPSQARNMPTTRLLISGGPGSGCTTTAEVVGQWLGVPVLDSDSYFHKPSDPPFQIQYSPDERRTLVETVASAHPQWVLSGSVATWGVKELAPTHAVFLHVPKEVRLERLLRRQMTRFGARIGPGGDMQEEHALFMEWAAGYEERTDRGRNLATDRGFLAGLGVPLLECATQKGQHEVALRIRRFLLGSHKVWHP